MSDPKRLRDSGADTYERALLRSARAPGPTNGQCDAVWSALEQRLALGTGGGAASTSSAPVERGGAAARSALSSTAAKGIALLVLAGSGTVALTAWRSPPTSVGAATVVSVPSPSVSALPSPVAAATDPGPEGKAVPPAKVDPLPKSRPLRVAPPVLPSPPSAVTPRPEESSAPERSSLSEESRLLLGARHALRAGDCVDALAQLDRATERFPSGALAQEREALAIEAAACAGREDEAARRASTFLRDYPSSPHADAVRRLGRGHGIL